MRRTCLHQALIDRAGEAGVKLAWGTRVVGLIDGGVALDGGAVRCRWVIGADGQNSRVRRWAGLDRRAARILAFWISTALSRFAVDRFHGDPLGLRFTNVCDSREPNGNLRGPDHA